MDAVKNPVKDDSSSEGEDVSESARLVNSAKKGSSSGSTPTGSTLTADGPLQRSPNTEHSKAAGNGVVLTGTVSGSASTLQAEDLDETMEDSETAKLLSGSKEQLTDPSTTITSSTKEVVKETKRKLIKVDQDGEKTEIIIERTETIQENFNNVDRKSSEQVITKWSEVHHENVVESKDSTLISGEEKEEKKVSDFENENDVVEEQKKKQEEEEEEKILIITETCKDWPSKQGLDMEEAGSEVAPSDVATTDSFEQDTDTYDLYQTVGSMTPNSLSNADVFRSLAATVASSQATFISAEGVEDVLGPTEDVPPSPRSRLGTDVESGAGGLGQLESIDLESREVEPGQSTPRVGTENGEEDLDGKETRQASQEHTEDEDTMREVTFEEAAVLAPVVMYPAQVHQYCPPGLEGLLDSGQLVIHRENLRHNKVFNNDALNRMEVIDISRKVLFYVEEEAPPLSEKSFLFKVYNRNKQEVMQIYNPQSTTCVGCGASWHCFRKCNFQTLVFAPLGQVAGFIKRSHTYFVQEYLVLNSQEDVMLVMRGGPDDLEIYTPDLENELGRLAVHHWHGIMHEVRRSHVDYGITFPIDLDVRVKAVLLGAVFALDWMYKTRGGRLR